MFKELLLVSLLLLVTGCSTHKKPTWDDMVQKHPSWSKLDPEMAHPFGSEMPEWQGTVKKCQRYHYICGAGKCE